MKRELFQNIKVQPFTSGDAIERTGFLSGVIGAVIGTAGTLTVTVAHGDDGENFEDVSDERLFIEKKTSGGEFTTEELAEGDIANIDLDFVGLKNFIKITVSGAAAANTTLAIALGDKYAQPV